MAILVGSNDTTNYTDTAASDWDCVGGATNRVYWLPWTASASGNVTTLGLYTQDMDWSGQSIKLLIANNSGTVLAATGAIAMNTGAGWKTGSISSTAVTASTVYRLGFINDSTGSTITYGYGHSSLTTLNSDRTDNVFASNPPASTIDSDGTDGYAQFLMYGDGTAGGASAPKRSLLLGIG